MSRNTFIVDLAGAVDAMQEMGSIPAQILQAQKRAIGTLRRRMEAEASRSIREEYNISKTRLAKGLFIRIRSEGVSIVGSGKLIGLINFGGTYSRTFRGKLSRGAKFSELRYVRKDYYAGSFIAPNLSGTPTMFERTGGAKVQATKGRYAGATVKRGPLKGTPLKREPLAILWGPSVATMLKNGRRPERLVDFAIRTLQAEQNRLLRK